MQEISKEDVQHDPSWAELRPVLDDAMDELPERDRMAVWLRVCEGRTFAEVGAKLAASEDAVRVRVDRALEKMRGALARRGIVSTTAALTTALAQEAGVMAPAGFAASVTGAALASGSAAGGGLAAWLGISTFMSTTKIAGWAAAVAVLCASLAGNAYLLTEKTFVPAAVTATASPVPTEKIAANAEPALATLAQLRTADLATLRDRLRAADASEESIRTMLEGLLRQRYRERLSADRAERARRGWWRDPARSNMFNPDYPMQVTDDRRLLREEVTIPLEQLLGPDPLAVAEADARYAYLPPELRAAFGRLDRSAPPSFVATGQLDIDAEIEADFARQRQAIDEERKGLVEALTPAQRLDWEMRNSSLATRLAQQLAPIDATEEEYRKMFPLADSYAKVRNTRVPEGADFAANRETNDHRMMEQLVTTFGYDRALDFIWGGALEYAPYASVARDANLPPATAARVMQLAAETARRATEIHADASLDVAQKRAALVALQKNTQPALDALVPPAVQQRLATNAQSWLTALGTGTYKPIAATLPGTSGLMMMMAQSVAHPPPANVTQFQRLPPRPPAKGAQP